MTNKFTVTGLGLTIDKTTIMPGSELILSAAAPAHWARFGTSERVEGKKLEVASPNKQKPSTDKKPD